MTDFLHSRPRLPRAHLLASALLTLAMGAQAQIVTTGPNPQTLPGCPIPNAGLDFLCIVEGQAQVLGTVSNFEAVRVSRTAGYYNAGGLTVGSGAVLNLNNAAGTANLVVGDNVGTGGALNVINGGQLNINVPATGNGSGGLLVGVFAAPGDTPIGPLGMPQPSTTALIANGGSVTVTKPGGAGLIAAAVGVGYGAGSNASLVLDGGLSGFGNQALGATLNTSGNLSIGRQGTGSVDLMRNATVNANRVWMSTIDPNGVSILGIGYQSTLNANDVWAGIALDPATGNLDPTGGGHGRALVDVGQFGNLNGALTLGAGGTLVGYGRVASLTNYGGVVGPGHSPGTLTIDGGYTDVGGHVQIEFGLTGQDRLMVSGPVSMNGTSIEFKFIEGFVPQAGFRFDFLDSNQTLVDLQNMSYSYSGLADGLDFAVEAGANGGLTFIARNAGVAIPLPATLPLVLLGLGGVGMVGRRRRL